MRFLPGLTALDAPLATFLAENCHAFTRAELLDIRTRTSLENTLRSGEAVRILPGIYAGADHARAPLVRGEAINLWHPGGLVTGSLALHLYSAHLPEPPGGTMRVTHGSHPRTPAWLRSIQGAEVRAWRAPQGVDCTLPELALLDAWRLAPPHTRRNLVWEALWQRVCSWRQLAVALERTPRLPQRVVLEQMLRWFKAGATSPLEVRARFDTFTGPAFADLEWQVWLDLGVRQLRADGFHRASRTTLEPEGDAYHSTRAARDADRARRTDLIAAGYAPVHFGWRDIADRPGWCRERLLTTIANRTSLLGGHDGRK